MKNANEYRPLDALRKNLKKGILSAAIVTTSFAAWSQDVLVKANGDEIEAKILEVSTTEVKYKKMSNLQGPTFTLPLSDIFMIKYANGEKDVFGSARKAEKAAPQAEEADRQAETGQPKSDKVSPAADNDACIAAFNNAYVDYKIKYKNKKANFAFGLLAFTPNSVVSGEDLKINIVQVIESPLTYTKKGVESPKPHASLFLGTISS